MKRIIMSAAALVMALLLLAGMGAPSYAQGMAPIAENLEFTTYRNTSFGGNLSAYDSDGDELCFEITTAPIKGAIELMDDGSFVYTPRQNKKGKDYFGYRAVDSEGNGSQEATVIITIKKQKSNVSYSDMEGSPAEYASILLSERGVFTGQQLCGQYQFCPNETVSRGEFMSMCMLLAGNDVVSGVMNTGYSDDESIPEWMKGYVSAAAINGFSFGGTDESTTEFDAARPISKTEAAVMLSDILGLKAVSYLPLYEELDAEAAQACANLSAYDVVREGRLIGDEMTRAEAAMLLASAINIIDNN